MTMSLKTEIICAIYKGVNYMVNIICLHIQIIMSKSYWMSKLNRDIYTQYPRLSITIKTYTI